MKVIGKGIGECRLDDGHQPAVIEARYCDCLGRYGGRTGRHLYIDTGFLKIVEKWESGTSILIHLFIGAVRIKPNQLLAVESWIQNNVIYEGIQLRFRLGSITVI